VGLNSSEQRLLSLFQSLFMTHFNQQKYLCYKQTIILIMWHYWKHVKLLAYVNKTFMFWGRLQKLIRSLWENSRRWPIYLLPQAQLFNSRRRRKIATQRNSSGARIAFNEICDHSAICVFRRKFHKTSSFRQEPNFSVAFLLINLLYVQLVIACRSQQ
jgi:hypothetical protein